MTEPDSTVVAGGGRVRDGYWTTLKKNTFIYYNEISETMEKTT